MSTSKSNPRSVESSTIIYSLSDNIEHYVHKSTELGERNSTVATSEQRKAPSITKSKSSVVSNSKMSELEAKIHAARQKFKFDEEIRELELRRKILQAENDAKLEELKSRRDLAVAEAMAQTLQTDISRSHDFEENIDAPIDPLESTKNWILDNEPAPPTLHTNFNEPTIQTGNLHPAENREVYEKPLFNLTQQRDNVTRNPPVEDSVPLQRFMPNRSSHGNPHLEYHPPVDYIKHDLQSSDIPQHEINRRLVASLTKQALPKCEPDLFSGDAALFLPWKLAFKTLMKDADATPDQELTYLLKYTEGKPRDLVNTFRKRVHPDSKTKVEALWSVLEERFGHTAEVTNALISTLTSSTQFKYEDREALQKFYDVCEDLSSQIPYLKGLEILNTSYFMKTLVEKLPKFVRDKWENKVTKYMVDRSHIGEDYPPFRMFVDMIHNLSLKKNHPAIINTDTLQQTVSNSKSRPTGYSNRTNSTSSNRDSHKSSYYKTLKTDVSPNSTNSNTGEVDEKCLLHPDARKSHTLRDCRAFAEKSYEEKLQLLTENRICFRCLAGKHFANDCTKDIRCSICKRRHYDVLHDNTPSSATQTKPKAPKSGESVDSSCTKICGNGVEGKSCGKIVLVDIYLKSKPSTTIRTYVTIDDQSNHTLGGSEIFEKLQINGESMPYTLETCHGKETCHGRRANDLMIRNLYGECFPLPVVIESNNIPGDKSEIPIPEFIELIPHLSPVAKQLPPLDRQANITMIIGRDASDLLKIRESINGPKGAAWAQRLDLGWTFSGDLCLERQGERVHISRRTAVHTEPNYEPCSYRINCKEKLVNSTDQLQQDEFFTTKEDNEMGMSHEDKLFLSVMDNGFHKNKLGNWEAPLPFRNPNVTMPDNREQAERRFSSLLRNFQRNEVLKSDYLEFMRSVIENGHASPVNDQDLPTKTGRNWYLPHFAVYHPKKPTQIRVVFDSSAEYRGKSLNTELLTGPDLMNKLLGRLHRFRQEQVGIMCDLQKMFYAFHVNPEHRSFLKFLWFKNNNPSEPIIDYHMNVHLFGNGPSPAIATYGLRKAAESVKDEYCEATRKFVREDFYVDDGVYSCETPEEAICLIKSAQDMLAKSNLRLHKVVSNSSEVMTSFPEEDRANGLKDLDFSNDRLPLQRSLGVQWDLEQDNLTFNYTDKERPYTRRGVLSIVHSLYDPLGFLTPFTIVGKRILQTLISMSSERGRHLAWDDPLPTELEAEWDTWNKDLRSIERVKVQRCFKPPDFGKTERIEIHGFCDASQEAIGAVVYFRIINQEGRVWVSFVKGSAKVRPRKPVTIPRMELCAAVLLVNIVRDIKRDIEYTIDSETYYSDSKVVLGYITNETKRFYVYVTNRVEVIRSHTSSHEWRYIETNVNPADLATRGSSLDKLINSNWLTGASFLWSSMLETPLTTYPLQEEDVEVRTDVKVSKTNTHKENTCCFCTYISSFNDWNKLKHAVAVLKLFARFLKRSHPIIEISPELLLEAETTIISHVQQENFSSELNILQDPSMVNKKTHLKGLQLQRLDPFIDQDSVLRVGGRLRKTQWPPSEKHPVILPKKHHITQLVIQHYHGTHHQGRVITHGTIRQAGFWIIGGAQLINSHIHQCLRCKLLRRPTEAPKMADLPKERLETSPPFTNVGMDAFGPWEVVTKRTRGGSASSKRWAVIFTCLASRAIHIEVVEGMDTSSFINALRRFMAIRGPVKLLWSDCGTNFIGARTELTKALQEIKSERVKKFLLERECKWKFNPPHASHFGGVWERQIGTLRRVLESMLYELGKFQLTHDLLVTLMSEAASIVNSRPITAVSSDPDNPEILSPASILTFKSRTYQPAPGEFTKPDLYCRKQWRRVQYLVDQFWTRWSSAENGSILQPTSRLVMWFLFGIKIYQEDSGARAGSQW